MRNKILYLALGALLLALGVSVEAQQPVKIPRIGYLSATGEANNPGPQVEAFRQGLRDLGYVEGKNILVECRYLEGKLAGFLPSLLNSCNSRSMSLSSQL
jgi:putative ABC transport system substrate-binding protein